MKAWWIWPVRSAATMLASSGMMRRVTSSTCGIPFLKYAGCRLSTSCCSTFQSSSMKGPVPSAALFRSPYFLMPASLMMNPQNPPRAARRPAKGSLVTNLMPYLPTTSTLSTAMKSDLPGETSKSRSKVNFTSAEVISWPSWNFTPGRSLNVQVRPSGLTCHDSASSGTGVMSGSKRTSWLYIMGERRLRENAGTSWGSRPVASVVCAEMKVPPSLAVWPNALRPRASVPSVRPPACKSCRRVRAWVMSSSSSVGVENVAEPVADQVERQHGGHDRNAREHRDPRRGLQIRPPLVQHVAPRRCGRLRRQSEIAQRGLDEDGLREGDGALHHERRQHVRQQMLERHHQPGGAQRSHRLDVLLLPLGQHRGPHDAHEQRRVDDRDGDDRAVHARSPHGRHAHRQQQPRD